MQKIEHNDSLCDAIDVAAKQQKKGQSLNYSDAVIFFKNNGLLITEYNHGVYFESIECDPDELYELAQQYGGTIFKKFVQRYTKVDLPSVKLTFERLDDLFRAISSFSADCDKEMKNNAIKTSVDTFGVQKYITSMDIFEAQKHIIENVSVSKHSLFNVDSSGQVIIETGVFLQKDGTFDLAPNTATKQRLSCKSVLSFFKFNKLFSQSVSAPCFSALLDDAQKFGGEDFANFVLSVMDNTNDEHKYSLKFNHRDDLIDAWIDATYESKHKLSLFL